MSTTAIDRHLADAVRARQAGRELEARQHFAAVLAIEPNQPIARNALGNTALAEGKPEVAADHFEAAVRSDPGAPPLWMNLAMARRTLGDDAGERDALEHVLSIDQTHVMALIRLAELNQRTGREVEAAQRWGAVVQLAMAMTPRPPAVAEAMARGQAFLAEHNRTLSDAIEARVGDAMLGPDAKRFKACVDRALGRRRIYQNQCHGLYYPFLPADEFFERSAFPWMETIEARTDAIRKEALAVLANGSEAIRPYVRQDPGTPENVWSQLDHSLAWSACFLWEYGERNEAVCALCPETAAALAELPQNRIPGNAPTAFFSILAPRTTIPPHTGVTNTRAIIHLPLVVPPGCRFRVGGETREWQEGEAFAFDDTIEHEAWNDSDEPRVVLIFDVWNPHLSETEQRLLQDFFAVTEERKRG
jgi:aspartyl/asparaginyl beta-hydroxylase (cupin superfamily)